MEGTRRQQIAELLKLRPFTAVGLAKAAGYPVKTILDDLPHIRRSVKPPEKWSVGPAECEDCGFTFDDRSRCNTPSRCPKCKSERIQDALFWIEGKKE